MRSNRESMGVSAMRFILVNIRYAAIGIDCAMCKTPIEKVYVRDFGTNLMYHNHDCREAHISAAFKAMKESTDVEFYR